MKVSYSRIGTFKQCPYQYYLRYIKGYKTKFNLDYENALVLGTALHTGIEKSVEDAIRYYYGQYPTVNRKHILEAYKLEQLIPKVKAILPNGIYEQPIEDDDFIGYMDLLVDIGHGFYDLYDFKYTNNIKNYLEKSQLQVYKHEFEKRHPNKFIHKMYFVFVPKIKQKRGESDEDYEARLKIELEQAKIEIVEIKHDKTKVDEFWKDAEECKQCTDFSKNQNYLCNWCDYKRYCESNGQNDSNIIYPEDTKED